MAIRTGSGGLKYPLPNQAQIQAQQAAAAASAGGSASASAYGANRRYAGLKKQLQYSAIESGLDRQFQAQQSYLDRGFRAEQAFFDREHEKGGQLESQRAAAERQAVQQGFIADQAQRDREFTTERDKTLFEREEKKRQEQAKEGQLPEPVEIFIDEGIETDIKNGKLVISEADQRELDRLEEGRIQAVLLDEEGQAEFNREYTKRKRAILRRATAPPDQAAQANQRQVYQDPETGEFFNEPGPGRIPGVVNQEGRFEANVAPQGDSGEYRKEVTKRAQSLVGVRNTQTGQPNDHRQALEEAARQIQEEDEFFNPPEGAPAAPNGDVPLGMGESVQARSSVDPSQEGLPPGTAEGAAWIDPQAGTIRLPDGRILRPKGQPAAQQETAPGAPGGADVAPRIDAQVGAAGPVGRPSGQPVLTTGGARHESEFTPAPGSGWQKQGEYWVNTGPIDLSKDPRFRKRGNAWVNIEAQ